MSKIVIRLIRFYQKYVSIIKPACCRFYPSCSEYMVEALGKYGFWLGIYLGLKRLMRCHPFNAGGYDPLE